MYLYVVLFIGLQDPPGCPGVSCCVTACLVMECIRFVSCCESLWWPMNEWCTEVCYLVVICLSSVWC
jgi:hypothetical protein